ncbi:hypothetical protein [Altericista sp. CCNU0014]|uniref:hypothetical protein n=1 Tax=Altericista sp. CCNU0014 TaxID=3082949 RepID=UPI00384A6DD7
MASAEPLKGIVLIDCAKANAPQGIQTAAALCGYGDDLSTFERELKRACRDIGIEIKELTDLMTDPRKMTQDKGIEIAPDTPSQL